MTPDTFLAILTSPAEVMAILCSSPINRELVDTKRSFTFLEAVPIVSVSSPEGTKLPAESSDQLDSDLSFNSLKLLSISA